MPLFVKARSLLRNLFLSRRVEVDLDQEVRSHLETLTEENIRAGMPPREAQRAARIELGGIEQLKEQVREERIGNWLHSVMSDCRFGVRQFRKNPGFTSVAILSLALGIGANTAIFSLIDQVVLRWLPIKNPEQLFELTSQGSEVLLLRVVRGLSCLRSQSPDTNWEVRIRNLSDRIPASVLYAEFEDV
jgi:hypothetical protein